MHPMAEMELDRRLAHGPWMTPAEEIALWLVFIAAWGAR